MKPDTLVFLAALTVGLVVSLVVLVWALNRLAPPALPMETGR